MIGICNLPKKIPYTINNQHHEYSSLFFVYEISFFAKRLPPPRLYTPLWYKNLQPTLYCRLLHKPLRLIMNYPGAPNSAKFRGVAEGHPRFDKGGVAIIVLLFTR